MSIRCKVDTMLPIIIMQNFIWDELKKKEEEENITNHSNLYERSNE